jgi:hypothetical protein
VSARQRHWRLGLALVVASGCGWVALLLADRTALLPRLCTAGGWDVAAHAKAVVALNPVGPIILSYLAMLAAMMAPLLLQPLRDVSDRSVPGRRGVAIFVYLLGYAFAWMLAAPLFGFAITWLASAPPPDASWPGVVPAFVALVWHMLPIRQYALNRCHRRLTGFVGPNGGLTPIALQAAQHGGACVVSCAPLMLVSMTLPDWHLPAMAMVAFFVWIERKMPPENLGWGPQNFERTARSVAYFVRHSVGTVFWNRAHGG